MNATTKSFFKSGKLKILFKPSFWVGGVSLKKTVSDVIGHSQRL